MIAMICDRCGKAIAPDDCNNCYEMVVTGKCIPEKDGKERKLHQNVIHYCEKCSDEFLTEWIERPYNDGFERKKGE